MRLKYDSVESWIQRQPALPFLIGVTFLMVTASFLFQNFQLSKKSPKLELLNKIAKFYEFPEGEEPTVASVTNKEKLKDQPFFARAENGDKVIIFEKAQKAILYRPSTNKIIEASPLGETQQKQVEESQQAPAFNKNTQSATVAIYNGTNFSEDEIKVLEKKLRENFPRTTVVTREDAKKKDYTQSFVIDVKGDKTALASDLAGMVRGKVTILPEGEEKPPSDILIILGR